MLTAESLRAALDYNPETGVFTWRAGRYHRRYAGTIAGNTHVSGHRQISIDGKKHKSHRLAWLHVYGEWPPGILDHINGDPADNRICNLRLATWQQNAFNRKVCRTNKVGLKGVTYKRRIRRWVANIHVNGEQKHIGTFKSPEEAHAAYVQAAKEHYGEFARAK